MRLRLEGQFLVRYGSGRCGCVTKDEISEFGMRTPNQVHNGWKLGTRYANTQSSALVGDHHVLDFPFTRTNFVSRRHFDCGFSHVNSPDCSLAVPQCLDDLLPYGEFSVLYSFGLVYVVETPSACLPQNAHGECRAIQRRDTWSHTSFFHFLTRI